MKLRYSATSPFTRKTLVCAHELGLVQRIDLVPTNPWKSEREFTAVNPLSKIPVLITDEGMVLYDSVVICEYLASLNPGIGLVPDDPVRRWPALRLQALSDGISDAAVTRRMETQRPQEQQSPDWIQRQRAIVHRGLDALERECGTWADALTIGQIAAGCALGYLDIRFADDAWRNGRSHLAEWYEQFASRPSMRATAPDAG